MSPWSMLVFVAALQLKHFICDGPLQTQGMVLSKGKYGDGLGIAHSLIHAFGTLVVLLVSGFSLPLMVKAAVADFLIHYHVDFCKENLVRKMGWSTRDAFFWWALSADQMLHQFTYLGIAAWVAIS